MKKKLFLLLLIVALAAFVFTGCTPPAEGEGEGEGEGEVTEPTIEIDGGYVKGQYTFVQKGKAYDVTVSFPAPVSNVELSFVCEEEDLTKAIDVEGLAGPLEPVEGTNRTVWAGKFTFKGCDKKSSSDKYYCSLGYLRAEWGECDVDCYARIPVIVDGDAPYAQIEVKKDDCCCETCSLIFTSKEGKENECDSCEVKDCCDDDCSGLASWQIDLYKVKNADSWDDYALFFDDCCDISPCAELVDTCTGTECPIKCETKCLEPGTITLVPRKGNQPSYIDKQPKIYFAAITLEDNVGNKTTYYGQIGLMYAAETITRGHGVSRETYEKGCHVLYKGLCCDEDGVVTPTDTIGACSDTDPCACAEHNELGL